MEDWDIRHAHSAGNCNCSSSTCVPERFIYSFELHSCALALAHLSRFTRSCTKHDACARKPAMPPRQYFYSNDNNRKCVCLCCFLPTKSPAGVFTNSDTRSVSVQALPAQFAPKGADHTCSPPIGNTHLLLNFLQHGVGQHTPRLPLSDVLLCKSPATVPISWKHQQQHP